MSPNLHPNSQRTTELLRLCQIDVSANRFQSSCRQHCLYPPGWAAPTLAASCVHAGWLINAEGICAQPHVAKPALKLQARSAYGRNSTYNAAWTWILLWIPHNVITKRCIYSIVAHHNVSIIIIMALFLVVVSDASTLYMQFMSTYKNKRRYQSEFYFHIFSSPESVKCLARCSWSRHKFHNL